MSVSGVIFFRNVNFSANVMINDPFVYLNLPQELWEVYLGVKIYPLNFHHLEFSSPICSPTVISPYANIATLGTFHFAL